MLILQFFVGYSFSILLCNQELYFIVFMNSCFFSYKLYTYAE